VKHTAEEPRLTIRQERFVVEYVAGNITPGKKITLHQAALNAGYSPKAAGSIGAILMTKPAVKERVRLLFENHWDGVAMGSKETLAELSKIARADMSGLIDPETGGIVQNLEAVELKVLPTKLKAIENLVRIHNLIDDKPQTNIAVILQEIAEERENAPPPKPMTEPRKLFASRDIVLNGNGATKNGN